MRPNRFTQQYKSNNDLVTVHYPATYAAQTVGKSVVILAENLDDGTDVALSFMSVASPISNELAEFDRVVHAANTKPLNRYEARSRRPGQCMGAPGFEYEGTWMSGDQVFIRRECNFLHGGHGFAFSFSYPASHPEMLADLIQIRDATEVR